MRRHRLDRLQKLAQGAAVISLGVLGTAACQDKSGSPKPEEPIHTNATAEPIPTQARPDMTPSMNATATPMPSSSTAPTGSTARPHTINAPANSNPLK